jgi:hypothetical protein
MPPHTVLALFADQPTARRVERALAEAPFAHERSVLAIPTGEHPEAEDLGSDSRLVERGFADLLMEHGLPEDKSGAYAHGVQEGGAVLLLTGLSAEDAAAAADLLRQHRPADPARRLAALQEHGHGGYNPVANPFADEEEQVSDPTRYADDHPAEEVAVVYVM